MSSWVKRGNYQNMEAPGLLFFLARVQRIFGTPLGLLCLIFGFLTACATSNPHFQQGRYAYDKEDFHGARTHWEEGLRQAKGQKNRLDEGIFLSNLGAVHDVLGQYAQARDYLEQALAVHRELGDPTEEGEDLGNLGVVYIHLGQYDQAQDYLEQALEIYQEQGNRLREAQTLTNLGIVHETRGKYSQARIYYEQARVFFKERDNRPGEATTLFGLGNTYLRQGAYYEALTYYEQARMFFKELNNRSGEAANLSNLGATYVRLGLYAQAQTNYEQALAITQTLGMRGEEVNNILNLGAVHQVLGQNVEAKNRYEQALELYRELKDLGGEAFCIASLGQFYKNLGQYDQAQTYLEQALALGRELGDRSTEAVVLANLGHLNNLLGQYAQALSNYEQALRIAEDVNEPETQWLAMKGLQTTYVNLKRVPTAIFFGKQAVNVLQGIRGQLVELEATLQQSFLRNKQFVYRELADLLIEEGRLWEAQQVLTMLKEEEYFDFIRRQAEADPRNQGAILSQMEQEWDERYQAIRGKLVTIGQDYQQLKEKKESESLTQEETAQLMALDQDLRSARQAFTQYFQDLQRTFAQQGRGAAITFGEKDLKSLKAFQGTLQRLGQDTVLIHFLPMADQLRIILTTANAAVPPIPRESSITAKELNTLIFEYREVLQNPQLDPKAKGQGLYRAILGPLEHDLKELKAKTLLVYLDGVMRYLPLAALYDGEHYIAERYGVVMYTTAAKAEIRTLPTPQWRVAGLGVSHGAQGFQALPAVEEELDGIIKDEGNAQDVHGVLPGRTFLNTQFSAQQLQTVLQNETAPYPVIHLASHFHFRPGSDVNSFLVLGKGERLTLAELQEGHYPMTHVDLLTLSACETGIGSASTAEGQSEKRKGDGREVEGFGVLAQNQGAKAVIATLWSVADRSTGQFMQWFYQLGETEKLTKAEAIRRVQEMFIRGETLNQESGEYTSTRAPGSGVTNGGQPFNMDLAAPYAHPYYWAPFILMGNFL